MNVINKEDSLLLSPLLERVNSLFWIELKNTYIRMVDDTSSGSLLPSKANLT